jgi:hypothetical protein
LGKTLGDVVTFDAERVLYDLGGLIAVTAIDGLFEQVTHLRHSCSASRFTAGAAGFLTLSQWSVRLA